MWKSHQMRTTKFSTLLDDSLWEPFVRFIYFYLSFTFTVGVLKICEVMRLNKHSFGQLCIPLEAYAC